MSTQSAHGHMTNSHSTHTATMSHMQPFTMAHVHDHGQMCGFQGKMAGGCSPATGVFHEIV